MQDTAGKLNDEHLEVHRQFMEHLGYPAEWALRTMLQNLQKRSKGQTELLHGAKHAVRK